MVFCSSRMAIAASTGPARMSSWTRTVLEQAEVLSEAWAVA